MNKDQNINSHKYFTFHPFITTESQDNRILSIFSNLTISDVPTANHWGGCVTVDKDGQEIGTVMVYKNRDGEVGSTLLARNPTNPSEAKTLNIFYTADGVPHTYCITPPSNSNDGNIATTAWVRQNATPTGSYLIWSTSTPPYGYLICDGAAISRTTYAKLFAVIGTTYGAGDGSTTFNLPNFNGRSVYQDDSIGQSLQGKVPNITSSTYNLLVNHTETEGAFYWNKTAVINWNISTGSGGEKLGTLNFDASRNSSVYDSTATGVVPAAVTVKFCIKYL